MLYAVCKVLLTQKLKRTCPRTSGVLFGKEGTELCHKKKICSYDLHSRMAVDHLHFGRSTRQDDTLLVIKLGVRCEQLVH